MLAIEGQDLLRVALLAALVGFIAFCASYTLFMWRKRNQSHRGQTTRLVRVAHALSMFGCASLVGWWALNEFRGRSGIVGGSELFVVHARREGAVQHLTKAATVREGEILAEFLSPADQSRLASLDVQRAQARARREAGSVASL